MSIQPAIKAAEHLISSTPILETKRKAVNAYLIKSSKGVGGAGGGEEVTITSSRKEWAEYYATVHPM